MVWFSLNWKLNQRALSYTPSFFIWSHSFAQDGLQFVKLLPCSWDYRCVPLHLADNVAYFFLNIHCEVLVPTLPGVIKRKPKYLMYKIRSLCYWCCLHEQVPPAKVSHNTLPIWVLFTLVWFWQPIILQFW